MNINEDKTKDVNEARERKSEIKRGILEGRYITTAGCPTKPIRSGYIAHIAEFKVFRFVNKFFTMDGSPLDHQNTQRFCINVVKTSLIQYFCYI